MLRHLYHLRRVLRLILTLPMPVAVASGVWASTAIVPDDYATVQEAIYSYADTVLVRSGEYPERIVVDHPLVLRGVGETRPQLIDMEVNNYDFWNLPRVLHVDHMAFAEPVFWKTLFPHPRNINLRFSHCSLDSGIFQALMLDPDDVASLSLTNCVLRGASHVTAYALEMVADTVYGSVAWHSLDVSISNSRFRGYGTGTGLALTDAPRGATTQCSFANYDVGLFLYNPDGHAATANEFEGCSTSVSVSGADAVTIADNRINSGSFGVHIVGSKGLQVERNAIWGADAGIHVGNVDGAIQYNVIGRSTTTGVFVSRPDAGQFVIGNNTIIGGEGSGILLDELLGAITVEKNIVSGNAGWGLVVPSGATPYLGCNVWFDNAQGQVSGTSPGATDMNVDPMFCDLAMDDVRLQQESPLIGVAGCGPIGALEVGCGLTATLLEGFWVESVEGGTYVRWQLAFRPEQLWLERRQGQGGAWMRLWESGELRPDGAYEFMDREVFVDVEYAYRLGWVHLGVAGYSTAHAIRGERAAAATVKVVPNPTFGSVMIEWTAQRASDVDTRIYDVHGREVALLARGRFTAGHHLLSWDGRIKGDPAPSGWYLVRIKDAAGVKAQRILLLR